MYRSDIIEETKMANCEGEQFSSEENLTLEELRNKFAQMNLPISGARSVLVAKLNRACSATNQISKSQQTVKDPRRSEVRGPYQKLSVIEMKAKISRGLGQRN